MECGEIRIYVSIPNLKPGHADPFGTWEDRDFLPALKELGHDIVQFDWFLPSSKGYENWLEKSKKKKNDQLIEHVKKTNNQKPIDVFLNTADERFVFPETVEQIKKIGFVTVNYSCDDVNAFSLIENLVSVFDYNWTNQLSAIDKYKRKNVPYIYTPFGANPDVYRPYNVKKEFDVTFVGRNMGYRETLIQMIANEGIDIHVWGKDWPHSMKEVIRSFLYTTKITKGKYLEKQIPTSLWYLFNFKKLNTLFGPPLTYEELIKMYSQSVISLNFSGGLDSMMYDFKHANKSMKLRDMEATMSGAFYLTEYSEEITKLFEVGKEIECFKSKEELLEKITYYLKNPIEAELIRAAGRKRALENYTWKRNFEHLFEQMGLKTIMNRQIIWEI
jgi:spore maturation protein CgeB